MAERRGKRGKKGEGKKKRRRERPKAKGPLTLGARHTEHSTRVPLLVVWGTCRQFITENTAFSHRWYSFCVYFVTNILSHFLKVIFDVFYKTYLNFDLKY